MCNTKFPQSAKILQLNKMNYVREKLEKIGNSSY